VVARSAAFFAGDVPGLSDTPPDFAGSDAEVAAGLARVATDAPVPEGVLASRSSG
jgi:hypothetical protein